MSFFVKKQALALPWIKSVEELTDIRIIRLQGRIDLFTVGPLEPYIKQMRTQKGYVFKDLLSICS